MVNWNLNLTSAIKKIIWLWVALLALLVYFNFSRIPIYFYVLKVKNWMALLLLFILLCDIIRQKAWPQWRFTGFNLAILSLTGLFLFGFIRTLPNPSGFAIAGIKSWIVLLGYLSGGYLVSAYLGYRGIRRLAEFFVFVGVAIICVQIFIYILNWHEVYTGMGIYQHFSGYSGNRNLFALQLLAALSFLLAYMINYSNRLIYITTFNHVRWIQVSCISIIVAGILLTSSRAGTGIALIIISLACFTARQTRSNILIGVSIGIFIYISLVFIPVGKENIYTGSTIDSGVIKPQESSHHAIKDAQNKITIGSGIVKPQELFGSSRIHGDNIRWMLIDHSLQLWRDNPMLGVGLGEGTTALVASLNHGHHNTALWVLSEFGLLGALVFGNILFLILSFVKRWKSTSPLYYILTLTLLTYLLASIVYRVYYEPILWIILGLTLAKPGSANFRTKKIN